MPPAVVAAGIGAAGAIGGGLIASHSTKSAAKQATDATTAAQNQATQAQLQLGQQSLGLNRDIYNSNYNLLSPFVSRGNVAGESINALLGLPDAPAMTSPIASTPQTGGTNPLAPPTPQQGLTPQQIAAMKNDGIPGNYAAAIGGTSGGGFNPLHILSPITNFM